LEFVGSRAKAKDIEKAEMSLKELALVIWSAARIQVPKESQLPVILEDRAEKLLRDCIDNQLFFNWKQEQENIAPA